MMILGMMIMNNKTNQASMMLIIFLFNMSLQTQVVSKLSYITMGDLISYWITNMTLMIMYIMMFMKKEPKKLYYKTMNMVIMILVVSFYNWSFFTFYMTFEMSMIMILVIVMHWGYQPERTEAMMFMIIMTLMFSLPLFSAMVKNYKTMNFWFIEISASTMTFIAFMFVFMMKMPIYFLHFWLPKMHVEAPVQGSMILAAVMLKLGCYGMIRMSKMMMKFQKTTPYLISMATWSTIILSMTCIMQTDLKTMIAYSSIVHMAAVYTNILLMKSKSIMSSMIIIIGHGMCSASLFLMANMMYEKSKSRSIMMNKNLLTVTPAMTIWWFTACMTNAPLPPSMNVLGELMAFKVMSNWSTLLYTIMFLSAFMSSMYSIYMFSATTQGKSSKTAAIGNTDTSKMALLMMTQIAPTAMIMVKPGMLTIN